jgi:DNA-binding CsgD family transcriptional regulator
MPSTFHIFPKAYSIAALVAQGLKNNEVARILGTTEHVVKNYLCALYDGSGMSNRTEFCAWWSAHHKPFLEGLNGLGLGSPLRSAKRPPSR